MKIAMLSPYSLSRPGGVQGQVLGLARALRDLGHEVTVVGPEDPEEKRRAVDQERDPNPDTFVMGKPTGLRSNGSVAPVTISPRAAMQGRALRAQGSASMSCTSTSRWRRWRRTGSW